jgi:hypothetical protein
MYTRGTPAYLLSPDGAQRYRCKVIAIDDDRAYVKFDDTHKMLPVYLRHLIPDSNPRAGRPRVEAVLSWLRKGKCA